MAPSKIDPKQPPKCMPNAIMEVTHAVERTEMIYNACQMRIFDKLAEMDRAVTSAELSEALELSKENYEDLERLLCCLSHLGLMEKITDEDGNTFRNTEETEIYLTTDSPYSILKLTDAARHTFEIAEHFKQKGVGDMTRTWFADVEENDKAYREIPFRFNRYYQKQDAYSKTSIHLLKAFDLSGFKAVVDLGGGVGSVCRALMNFYPGMEVTNLDMPSVVEYAKKQEQDRGLTKLNYAAVDVFGEEPMPKADLYIVGHLLHMFRDDVCIQLLKRIQQYVNPGGSILILEKVMMNNMEGPELCLLYNMRMSLSFGRGKERTKDEFRKLLAASGFAAPEFYLDEGYSCYDAILAKKVD